MLRYAAPFLVLALPLAAETPMSAAEFDAYTRGKTLFYSDGGIDFGAEEYLPNRRVLWTFLDGECVEGTWYEAGGLICFDYEDFEAHQCWSFFEGPSGLIARFENDPTRQPLYETRESREPLQCIGPKVGV
jgi:hypothetical protein